MKKINLLILYILLPNVLLSKTNQFKLGIENITNKTVDKLNLENNNIAIVTNQTGVDQNKNRNINVLNKYFNIKTILVPEHGLEGLNIAGQDVNHTIDKKTKTNIISLYKNGGFQPPSEESLKDISSIFFDIQDAGMRHYTYVSTLYKILEIAGKYNKRVIILDRPNPLGTLMEGPLVEPELESFISIAPIPLRHGMTFGELALYFNKYLLKDKVHLTIVPMANYKRNLGMMTDMLVPLSPNINSLNSCYGYSFLGLIGEISPFKVGVGTKKPFQCITIPKDQPISTNKWNELGIALNKLNISCTKRKNGLNFQFKDINEIQSMHTLFTVLDFFKNSNIELNFSKSFNKAAGTKMLKMALNVGINKKKFAQKVNLELKEFYDKASSCFIYEPKPKMILI